MKSTKLMPRATKFKLSIFAFLFSVLFGIILYHFIGIAGAVFLFFWIWVIITIILVKVSGNKAIKQPNALAIIAVVKEIQYGKQEKEKTGWEIIREEIYTHVIDFRAYLQEKGHNKNIAIIGMAGSGKTELTYYIISQMKEYKKIIFQYKNSDRYRELGYPVLFVKHYGPDVFRDKEAFTQAWITAFSVENRGITASQTIPLIRSIVDKCNNWKEFKAGVEKQLEQEKNGITSSALSDILLKMDSVYSENQYDLEIPENIVVDFEGLNKDAFVFYAEYLLRELYEQVKSGTRTNTMIFVDEAHVFTKSGNTIIPELSAIIRSRGAFLFATQRASTIAGDIKGNAGTQFCFKQTEREDLNEVSALSQAYHWIVQRLKPYEFVDLAQQDSHEGIFVFRLFNPKPDFKPVIEWKPQDAGKKESSKDSESKGSKEEINIPTEIITLLSTPANQQDLAKRFAEKYGKEVGYWKLKLKSVIAKMIMLDEINSTLTDYVKFVADKPYEIEGSIILHRKSKDYDYHDWLVGNVAEILHRKGLIPLIQPHGLHLADILAEYPKRAYEIETGSKNGYKIDETESRVKEYEKQGYKVYVIVPNAEVREKYARFPNVMTALELWKYDFAEENIKGLRRQK
jgi:hypothetical protein